MTVEDIRETIEHNYETELSRLGSSKAMYALSEGDMTAESIRATLASRLDGVARVLSSWTVEDDSIATESLDSLASTLEAHAQQLHPSEEGSDPEEQFALAQQLSSFESQAERTGGLLGWLLVIDETLSQAVGFFVGNADPSSADTLRSIRDEISRVGDNAVVDLATGVTDDEAFATVEASTETIIETAYDEYVATLEELGVQVKPVC